MEVVRSSTSSVIWHRNNDVTENYDSQLQNIKVAQISVQRGRDTWVVCCRGDVQRYYA